MLGLYVTVPIACWRRGQAREYLETEVIPPPSTCYGFLLSLVGEEDRERHRGVAVTCGRFGPLEPPRSTVLRTLWRVKSRKEHPGSGENARPDYQQLLTGSRLVIWCDSAGEPEQQAPHLEVRVAAALSSPEGVSRFGGLSLGESTHLVDDVRLLRPGDLAAAPLTFLLDPNGHRTLPVWVDHVGSAGSRYVTGNLRPLVRAPSREELPAIPFGT